MALVRGKDGVVTVQATGADGTVTGTAGAVGKVTAFEFEQSAGAAEAKYMGGTAVERFATFVSWSGTVSALFDPADTAGQGLALAGALVEVEFQPEGGATGKVSYTGKAWVTSVKVGQEAEGYASFELGLSGTGTLTKGTV